MRTLLDAIYHRARTVPSKPAILAARQGIWTQWSYADLAAETDRWARFWHCECPQSGQPVFIILSHRIEMYAAFLGAMRAGLVPSFLPHPTNKQDPDIYWSSQTAVIARVQPAAILSYGDLLPAIHTLCASTRCKIMDCADCPPGSQFPGSLQSDLPHLPGIEDAQTAALLQHSSGTTGLKKGVVLTYDQICKQVTAYAGAIGATADDRIASWLPVYHDMGLVTAFLMPLTVGALVISIDAFDWLTQPDAFFDLIAKFRATLCWLPNFALQHLVRTRDRDRVYDLSSVRAVINCSEPCKPDTMDSFQTVFASHGLREDAVQTCYAMAEMVFAVTQSPVADRPTMLSVDREALTNLSHIALVDDDCPGRLRVASCGTPIAGASVRIVPMERLGDQPISQADSVRSSHASVLGEVQVAGAFLFGGYLKDPFRSDFDGAWFRTGDVGFIHAGELYICGRIKEMLIVHGRNYYANDIEEVVGRVAGVKPGRVVAGSLFYPATASEEAVVTAETNLPDEGNRKALEEAIREQVFSTFSLSLRQVEIADEGTLIKTTSGKMSRSENMKRFAQKVLA